LWTHAQSAAQESLEILRSEAKGEVLEARTAKALAENERFVALLELDQAKQATAAASEHQLQLERDLAAERATSAALTSQLETIQRQQTVLEAALAEARRDFAAELEMHRKAQGLSQERYEATEKRALTEIDRERTSAAKLQKELAQSRQSQQEAEARHRSEVAQLQADLDSAHQKSGMAEGMLLELRTRYQQQTEESKLLRTTVAEHETEKGLLKYELAACRENVAKLERQLQEWMAAATPERQVRKTHQKNSKKGRIAELL
jgi:chromosome segregation ATPase